MPSKALLTLTALLLAVFSTFNLNGQIETIPGTPVHDFDDSKTLNAQFSDFEVYQIDANYLKKFARGSNHNIKFNFELGKKHDWTIAMTPHNVKKQDFELRIAEDDKVRIERNFENITYKGYVTGGNSVRMTINDDFIYGLFEQADDTYYIEPLYYLVPKAPKNLFLVYGEKDVTPIDGLTCGFEEEQKMSREWRDQIEETHSQAQKGQLACYDVEVALAADWLLRQSKGSVTATQNFMFGVLNNVAANYDDEFSHDLNLISGSVFVPNNATADPFTTSTNASTLLNSFRSWGNANGFGTSFYDVASLWTARDLAGSTIGIAWVGGTCSNSRYNVCEDFGGNANNLRVLQAHELGHNFDALHDGSGSGFIMAPAVNNTSTWSSTSISDINSFVNLRISQGGCFTPCGGGGTAPTADFTSDAINPECVGNTINFTDQSTDNPDTWLWDFGDGTTSTQQDPSHSYAAPGFYDVELTASNAFGSDVILKTAFIEIAPAPVADFIFSINNNSVDFTDFSTDATSWFWDFDNGVTSTQQNPTAFYGSDGFYDIELTASNACGSDTFFELIEIVTPPTAAFTSDVTDGCSPLTVQFTDQSSSNTTEVEWFFPTGTPSNSTAFNPVVTFSTPGPHDVTLIAKNSAFQDQLDEIDYINVEPGPPTAGFTSSVNLDVVTFTDQSFDAETIEWDFDDGSVSFLPNPVHTYAMDGTYIVTQTVTNICGTDVSTEVITIVTPPVADFDADEEEGCIPFTVNFFNQSSDNSLTYEWTFPGGSPSTSTDEFPSITYPTPGVYDVTLKVSNSIFDDTFTRSQYITVGDIPIVDFTSLTNGSTVDFTNTSQNYDFLTWDFGDGNTSTLDDPSHTYANDGTYVVELEVENDCGLETKVETITIVTQNTAGFSAATTSGCTDLTVNFINSSSNSTSYLWTFPGGTPSTSTDANPTVVYANVGSFDVTLEASNSGFTDVLTLSNYISTSTTPTPGFTSSTNNNTATFTSSASGQTSISWDFGDGNTSTETNPVHTYATGGTYTVVQTTTNGCGSTTASEQLNITLMPSAGFSANATTGCNAFTVVFNNTSSANSTSFLWSFPGGNPSTSTEMNPTVVYNTKGNYDVTLTATNAVGNDVTTMTNFITVEDLPAAAFNESIANFTVATFTNTSADASSYLWDFGNGNTSTDANPTFDFGTDGVYNVELKATNNCGTVSFVKTLTIVTPPTADFNTMNLSSGCTPYQVQFTSLASANATSVQWNFPGGTPATSTDANPIVIYNNVGAYNVELSVVNSAGNDTELKQNYINVETTPTAGFTPNINLAVASFTNTSTGGASVSWNFGDGNTATDMNPTHTYAADGTYSVVQSVTNNCGTVTSTQSVTIVTPPTADFNAGSTSGCEPLTVQFNNQSSVNAAAYSWTFPGGTPATSTDANPTVVYNTKGNYDVELTVSNSQYTDTKTFTQYIDVNGVPVADFVENTNLAVVNLTNNSTDATSYSWDFGDGNTSTEANPTYTYSADGMYNITLSATNACGTVTSNSSVTILTPPRANFSSDLQVICEQVAVTFENLSSINTDSILWLFPDGRPAVSRENTPTIVYSESGIYDVSLIAYNDFSTDTLTFEKYIEVLPLPNSDFDFISNDLEVQFQNTSTFSQNYEWHFGDNTTSSSNAPQHTFPENGIYEVQLIGMNQCGLDTIIHKVVVSKDVPVACFESDKNRSCLPSNIQFFNQSSSNTDSVLWKFEGGNPAVSTDMNPSVQYSAPGIYEVSIEAVNRLGKDTLTQTSFIEILDVPTSDFSYSIDLSDISVTFTNNSTAIDSTFWDFGDGNTSILPNPVHIFSGNGDYPVNLTVKNICGVDSFDEIVRINGQAPTVESDISFASTCVGDTIQFYDLTTGSIIDRMWTFPGGTPASSTEMNPKVVYSTTGLFDATLEVRNVFGSSTSNLTEVVSIDAPPVASFVLRSQGKKIIFDNTSLNGETFHWDFGDRKTSSKRSPEHIYTRDGTFHIELSVFNGCASSSVRDTLVLKTTLGGGSDSSKGISGLDDLSSFESLNIYPNPNEGRFTVEINGTPTDEIQFRILNGLGQLMKEQQVDFRSGYLKQQFDLNLSAGIYMLQIQSNGETGFRKIEIH